MGSVKKGVLLLGGSGSRLENLSKITNKHLLPVGNKPMAQWNVEKLVNTGIEDILIVTGKEHLGDIVAYFGSGKDFGCKFTYKVQDEAGGIAQALQLVDGFVEQDEFFWVILGDNIFNFEIPNLNVIRSIPPEIYLYTKVVEDPERFGVYYEGIIEEKPENPKSNQAVLGIYGYTYNTDFKSIIFGLEKSDRGEIEVTDLNNQILDNSTFQTIQEITDEDWSDAGTLESYKKVNQWEWVWK